MPDVDCMANTECVELHGPDAARLLREALRDRTRVRLTLEGRDDTVSGTLCAMGRETCTIQTERPETLKQAATAAHTASVEFERSGQPFSFSTMLLSVDRSKVYISRPSFIRTRQRRRFWRAAVRESAPVEVMAADGAFSVRGEMLNLSAAGLACRVPGEPLDALRVGTRLRLRFTLEDQTSWEVSAWVRAMTPASDPRQRILRVEFQAESVSPEMRRRLAELTGDACGPPFPDQA